MLNYIIAVNRNMSVIVLDFETDKKNCKPDIGYETDCEDWVTNIKEYLDEYMFFNMKKAFKTPGLYKVFGYDNTTSTPDGDCYDYHVEKIVKLQDLSY